jgi:hypothetical protein
MFDIERFLSEESAARPPRPDRSGTLIKCTAGCQPLRRRPMPEVVTAPAAMRGKIVTRPAFGVEPAKL